MAVQVVDVDYRHSESERQAFGEARADEKRAEQTRTASESDCRKIRFVDACAFDCSVDHRHYILLMSARREFGDNAAVLFVYALRCNDVAEKETVGNDGCRCVVA